MPPELNWVTCDEYPEGCEDDQPAILELRSRGVQVRLLSWNHALRTQTLPTGDFIFRSPWDYYKHFKEFQNFLNLLDSRRVMNPIALIQWNADKIYLDELDKKGVRVFSTRFVDPSKPEELTAAINSLGSPDTLILKPSISAGSHDTFKVGRPEAPQIAQKVQHHSRILVQPYGADVETEGEYSVHFFKAPQEAAKHSHTIVKKPKPGDFRVQEMFGGSIKAIEPDPALMHTAEQALEHLPFDWLYARVDCLRFEGEYCLAELEVFEPCLYFRFSATAPKRFADAVVKWLESK